MSISTLTSASLLDDSLTTALTKSANQTSAKTASTFSAATTRKSSTSGSSSGSSPDLLTQDIINLLKDLAFGDVSGAKNDLVKFKTDLKAQSASVTSNSLAKDATALIKDLASGNSSAAKTDVSKLQADLQAQDTSTTSTTPTVSPLESLVAKISDALSSGAVQGAVQDLAGYLVQNGQATGSLINTTA